MSRVKSVCASPYLWVGCFVFGVLYPQLFTPHSLLRLSDFILPYSIPKENHEAFWYSWTTYGFGQLNVPSMLRVALDLLVRLFGAPLAQQVVGFLPFFIGALGMCFFLLRTGWLASRFWVACLSVLYVVNWFVFPFQRDEFGLMTVTGFFWNYAFLPFFLFFAYRLFVEEKLLIKYVVALALSVGFCSLGNAQAFIVAGVVLVPFLIHFAIENRHFPIRKMIPLWRRVLLLLTCWSFLTGLIIAPILSSLFSSFFSTGSVQNIYGGKATILPVPGTYQNIFPHFFSPFFLLSGPKLSSFIQWFGAGVPLVIVYGIFHQKDGKEKRFNFILLLLFLALTVWVYWVAHGFRGIGWAYSLPGVGLFLQVFRAVYKTYVLFGPALILLFARGLQALSSNTDSAEYHEGGGKKYFLRWLRVVSIVSVISIFGCHRWILFHLQSRLLRESWTFSGQGGVHVVPFGRISPEIVFLSNWLKERNGAIQSRTLWLPGENEVWCQTTQQGVESGFSYPSFPSLGYYQKAIADSLSDGSAGRLAPLLTLLHFRYIVVLKFIRQSGPPRLWAEPPWGEHIVGDPDEISRSLRSQRNLKMILNSEKYDVYENNLVSG